jgi:hypothetical protein
MAAGAVRGRGMTDETQLDALIDAGAALLRIPLQEGWRPAIRLHLDISLTHASMVLDFALPDECDPAPVFIA